MITVKDLVEKLQTFDQDMPVYWGVDDYPCWIAKKDATIENFPMMIDAYMDQGELFYYLYFADHSNYKELNDKYRDLRYKKAKGILNRIRDYIFGWNY